jgi:hypothetical protein
MRTCAENESFIRGERGDSEMNMDKILTLMEMPDTYSNHIETKIDTLLFNNPTLKKYVEYNPYPETAIEYNLQPRVIPDTNEFQSSYANDIYLKLPLSIYENIPIRELDSSSII